MKFLLLTVILFLVGCDGIDYPKTTQYGMRCEDINWRLDRCENDEVICYIGNAGKLQCKFK